MHITKIQLQYSSFIITYSVSCTILNIIWFYFTKYRYATITFFLSTEPIIEIAHVMKRFMIHIFSLCFCFLQTNYISRISFEPIQESFIDRSPQAIDIIRNDTHSVKVREQDTRAQE